MATTSLVRDWWHLYRCTHGSKVPGGMFGRTPVYAQHADHVTALEAAHLGAGYVPTAGGYIGSRRNCPAGIGGQNCEPSGRNCSLHNYGLAWDVEYNYNPHFRRRLTETDLTALHAAGETKYTPQIVAGILAVKNTHGEQLFRWLGYTIGDTMHWQINVPPERAEVDWGTVPDAPQPEEGDEVLKNGDTGRAVTEHQQALLAWDPAALPQWGADGDFGDETETWVRTFQQAYDIDDTGVIGGVTSALLLGHTVTGQPGPPGPQGPPGSVTVTVNGETVL